MSAITFFFSFLFFSEIFSPESSNLLPKKMHKEQSANSLSSQCSVGLSLSVKSVIIPQIFPFISDALQDRENEARFGATPVPGKIGMAMAGQGLNAAPPPRPPSHNYFGTQANPGNQLYVGNVGSRPSDSCLALFHMISCSCPIKRAGKTSKTCSALLVTSFVLTSTLAQMGAPRVPAPLFSRLLKMPNRLSVGVF